MLVSFLEFCSRKDYKVYIVSDGYNFNIETISKKYRLELTYYANHLVYQNGAFYMEPRYPNPSCGHCGTCKIELINCLRGEAAQVVYIGDGYSDLCAANCADQVFAKGVLFDYCREHGLPAVMFNDFSDILSSLLEF